VNILEFAYEWIRRGSSLYSAAQNQKHEALIEDRHAHFNEHTRKSNYKTSRLRSIGTESQHISLSKVIADLFGLLRQWSQPGVRLPPGVREEILGVSENFLRCMEKFQKKELFHDKH
jgi:hypothetical protein